MARASDAYLQDLRPAEYLNTASTNNLDEVPPLKAKHQIPEFEPWVNDNVRDLRQACSRAERK